MSASMFETESEAHRCIASINEAIWIMTALHSALTALVELAIARLPACWRHPGLAPFRVAEQADGV